MNFKALLSIFLLLGVLTAYGQDSTSTSNQVSLKKNIIYATAGYAGLYAALNGNYERIIIQKQTGFFKNYMVRIGGGVYVEWGGEGSYAVTGLTGLTGLKKSHLELHLGIAYSSGFESLTPAVGIGYRYQKPGGQFVFRVGASFPESFYLSLGFCF